MRFVFDVKNKTVLRLDEDSTAFNPVAGTYQEYTEDEEELEHWVIIAEDSYTFLAEELKKYFSGNEDSVPSIEALIAINNELRKYGI